MKYASIDIETTGLNPETDNILEIGIIIEDTKTKLSREECPTFHCYVDRENYSGNAFALAMNADIFKTIVELKKTEDSQYPEKLIPEIQMVGNMTRFLLNHFPNKMVVAGKNFPSFDLQFIKKLPGAHSLKFHHRFLDPSMFFVDFNEDEVPPDTSLCKKRAGFSENVSHKALDDAWDVIQLLRTRY